MQRFSWATLSLPIALGVLGFAEFIPLVTHAATLAASFGPIISTACNCDPVGGITANGVTVASSAPAWGCILATFQNAINFLVAFSAVIITIFIAWAGVTYMTSGGSPEKRSTANRRIMNAVIGLVITLCAWLLIDSLMKVIYNPNAGFGPWNSILAGNGAADCLVPVKNAPQLPGGAAATNPNTAPTPPAQQSTVPAVGDCSQASLDQTWGSSAVGNTFACIVNNESHCQNILTTAASQVAGSGSSAGGRYQVLVTSGPKGQSELGVLPACVAIDHGINCDMYFHNGYSDGSANAQLCQQALLDPNCNTQVAMYLYNSVGFSPWLGKGDIGGKNQSCVNTYDH